MLVLALTHSERPRPSPSAAQRRQVAKRVGRPGPAGAQGPPTTPTTGPRSSRAPRAVRAAPRGTEGSTISGALFRGGCYPPRWDAFSFSAHAGRALPSAPAVRELFPTFWTLARERQRRKSVQVSKNCLTTKVLLGTALALAALEAAAGRRG